MPSSARRNAGCVRRMRRAIWCRTPSPSRSRAGSMTGHLRRAGHGCAGSFKNVQRSSRAAKCAGAAARSSRAATSRRWSGGFGTRAFSRRCRGRSGRSRRSRAPTSAPPRFGGCSGSATRRSASAYLRCGARSAPRLSLRRCLPRSPEAGSVRGERCSWPVYAGSAALSSPHTTPMGTRFCCASPLTKRGRSATRR